jgi:type II secretory pathway component PulJ
MQRPGLFRFFSTGSAKATSGYTLVEILVATALSLILLGAVVRMFGDVGQSITDSRSMLEAADRLRLTAARLQQDLAGVTVTMSPPRKPENNEGYFEYIEGPVGTTTHTAGTQMTAPTDVAFNTDVSATTKDSTVGDFDDILMFTTRSTGQPFIGRYNGNPIQSDVAEVAWFVRGRTLYRRVLLVSPAVGPWTLPIYGFYTNNDISASIQNGNLVANTLGDLTKRENRFAHQTGGFPFSPYVSVAPWTTGSNWLTLRLPTLCECSFNKDNSHYWNAGNTLPNNTGMSLTSSGQFDAWRNPLPYTELDRSTGAHSSYYTPGVPTTGQRIADDVILTNVIGFDVKAWDPTYNGNVGAYVDLGYNNIEYNHANYSANSALANGLSHLGHPRSGLAGTAATAATCVRVYDTYSFHYENDGVRQNTAPNTTGAVIDAATNGFDDNGNGVIDDIVYTGEPDGTRVDSGENETAPPYPIPLRGIQVKIRVFEPDSRQVREVTVVQDFLSQ